MKDTKLKIIQKSVLKIPLYEFFTKSDIAYELGYSYRQLKYAFDLMLKIGEIKRYKMGEIRGFVRPSEIEHDNYIKFFLMRDIKNIVNNNIEFNGTFC